MSDRVTLSSDRICLRRWHDEDREVFAAMNADARVMKFFRAPLGRADSDAMVDGIQNISTITTLAYGQSRCPVSPPLSVSPDWQLHGSVLISRPVWKSAGVLHSIIGDMVTQLRRPDWRLTTVWSSRAPGSRLFHNCD